MGVIAAAIVYFGQQFTGDSHWNMMVAIGTAEWAESNNGAILSFFMFALLLVYMYWDSKRAKVEE